MPAAPTIVLNAERRAILDAYIQARYEDGRWSKRVRNARRIMMKPALHYIKDLGNEVQVNDYVMSLPTYARAQFRTLWKDFGAWVSDTGGRRVAKPKPGRRGPQRKQDVTTLPDKVVRALFVLIEYERLPALTIGRSANRDWRTLDWHRRPAGAPKKAISLRKLGGVDPEHVQVGESHRRWFPPLITKEGVDAYWTIKKWARTQKKGPFLPVVPESAVPVSPGLLRQIIGDERFHPKDLDIR